MQGEAAGPLPPLDERAPPQSIDGFQYLHARQRGHQHGEQFLQRHRLAQNRQPGQHRLLQAREPRPLLLEQIGNAAKDGHALGKEQVDGAAEEVGDGLGHDIEGQRVARIRLHQPGALLWGADHLVLGQQLLARHRIQPGEAQGAHRGAAALQAAQLGGFLP